MKDWTGNGVSIYSTLGASNHTADERQLHDFYATDPLATKLLLNEDVFSNVWEPACGNGMMASVLDEAGVLKRATDLYDYGYGESGVDFLKYEQPWEGDIVTNPPYKYAKEFIVKSLSLISDGCKVAMFLRLQFLESKSRKGLFLEFPPETVYVASGRLKCYKNGDIKYADKSNAVAYAWFVWKKGYKGNTVIKWIN